MKKYLILPLVLALTNSLAFANAENIPKQIQIPFTNLFINSTKYEGLSADYHMHSASTQKQKVVCDFSNLNKGWIDYSENGVMKESGTFGGGHTVILTSAGQTKHINNDLFQLHADADAHLLIHTLNESSDASVSCVYQPDESTNN